MIIYLNYLFITLATDALYLKKTFNLYCALLILLLNHSRQSIFLSQWHIQYILYYCVVLTVVKKALLAFKTFSSLIK